MYHNWFAVYVGDPTPYKLEGGTSEEMDVVTMALEALRASGLTVDWDSSLTSTWLDKEDEQHEVARGSDSGGAG